MPDINRIRVNNVKYNFGTQSYDDFTMRLYGQNTLYDLANGGGKSVLMLLLMQCMIPNCTLDDKQPLEKLFRENCGNGTIHSLIEWRLDPGDVVDGFRFMTTGFCARKARDRGEEQERDVASVEYFNYCIFYQEYGKQDIVNLPLSNGEERMTYQALKNYLHDLSRRENRVKVFIFDRKGEYQRFISRYGIIESQWEIVRGINKTEGHVRTYFETNYRTTRKVVEDLLIEEIIEKAYMTKTGQEEQQDGSAASLLMTIRDQLRLLAEKKKDIRTYDHEAELVELLRDRISSFGSLYGEKEQVLSDIGSIYLTLDQQNAGREKELAGLQAAVDAAEQERDTCRARVEALKTQRLKRDYQEKTAELEKKKAEVEAEAEKCREEENAINRRRAELDYLSLMEEQRKLEGLISEEKAEVPEEIAPVVAGIRVHFDREEERLSGKIQDGEEKLRTLEEGGESLRKYQTDVAIELAVLAQEEASLLVERADQADRRKQEMDKLSETSFTPVAIRVDEVTKALDQAEEDLLHVEGETFGVDEKVSELTFALREMDAQILTLDKQIGYAERIKDAFEARKERLLEIGKIYRAEGASDPNDPFSVGGQEIPVDTEEGREMIRKAVYKKLSGDMVRLAGLEKDLVRLEKRREEIKEGRLIKISEGVSSVMSYISTRHGTMAMYGMDYLAQLPKQEQMQLLTELPELPYGIVVKEYEKLLSDEVLQGLETSGNLVRIYDRAKLGTISREVSDGYFTLHKGEEFFLSEKTEQELLKSLNEAVENAASERDYLRDAVETEKKDLDFLLSEPEYFFEEETAQAEGAGDRIKISSGTDLGLKSGLKGMKPASPEKLYELKKKLLEERKKLSSDLEMAERGKDILTQSLARCENECNRLSEDLKVLMSLVSLERESEETVSQLKEVRERKERLSKALGEKEGLSGTVERDKQEIRESLRKLEEERVLLRVTWQEQYAPYAENAAGVDASAGTETVRNALHAAGGTREELEAQFRKWKQGHDAAEEVLRQRNLLRQAIESSIERLKQSISDRRIEIGELASAYEEGLILPGEVSSLREREDAFRERKALLEERKALFQKEANEAERISGSIAYAVENYENAFGPFPEEELPEDPNRAVAEAEEYLGMVKERLAAARTAYADFQKKGREWDGLYREAGRLVERYRVDLSKVGFREDGEDLQREFDDLLLRLDRNDKNLERAKSQMLRTRGQVTETLTELGATGLSQSIRDDAELPGNREEAESLTLRLTELQRMILLERSRVEQGLSDMESLKENFVEQCLERCLDVRTELDKLPHLSQISMGEETVQMVKLSIPYVKDEFLRGRMAEYIDRIVSEADSRKTEEEQYRYLRSELALKRLFSVIVTDMNAIRLQLYKRERVASQSRYLKYEEAVGSTGQSQGIYIQFLVSVMSYISGMYAMQDSGIRRKTIFIDNPFGAAKDIYIWEPIFALLRANHVQLIVPSRGATPEITGRFDVNYILGQQMAEGRAITVVEKYSSRSKEEALEYKELAYEQVTFDFI